MATSGDFSQATDSIEIKIKTLDSQTHHLRVDKCLPVPLLKDQIADLTGIESNQQRLICRGKVLGDNENLSHYHVEDGHTLHLVVKQPPESSSRNPGAGNMSDTHENQNAAGNESIVLEAINIEHRRGGFPNIGPIISSIINSIASGGAQSLRTEVGGTNDESGPSDSSQVHPNPSSFNPSPIPDSLTTISQYLEFMNEEFRRAGFGANNYLPFGHGNGMQCVSNLSQAAQSTRMLMNQARGCLSQLAEQLSDHTNMAEESSRAQLQALSMRSGVLMQNLGSLLLELGRTAMMFHAGPTPQEASVNAGPAVFISGNGPNPLMVQPVPFFPGSSSIGGQTGGIHSAHTGGIHSGHGSDPIRIRPRSIDIHIRTGRVVPAQQTDTEQQAGTQAQEQTDPAGNNSSHSSAQAGTGEQGGGVRVVPIRMVAVPVLARVSQQVPAGRENISGGSQLNSQVGRNFSPSERSEQPNGSEEHSFDDFSSMLNDLLGRALNGEHIHSTPIPPPNPLVPTRDPVQVGSASSQASEEGVQFANLLRQVLPAVSEMVPSRNLNIRRGPSSDQANHVDPFEFDEDAQPPPRIVRANRRRLSEQARNSNDSNNPDDSREGSSSKRQRNNE
ncbi:hypothetical protein LUZ60_008882 [Juncus effusus]|nr:hypothetical protein LUZ60_008882 [Juncus effusus]